MSRRTHLTLPQSFSKPVLLPVGNGNAAFQKLVDAIFLEMMASHQDVLLQAAARVIENDETDDDYRDPENPNIKAIVAVRNCIEKILPKYEPLKDLGVPIVVVSAYIGGEIWKRVREMLELPNGRVRMSSFSNPYYWCVLYVILSFVAAAYVIYAPASRIEDIYHHLHSSGLESALLNIPRADRVHQFLVEHDNLERWKRICVFFSFSYFGLALTLLISLSFTSSYLTWYYENTPAANQLLTDEVKKGARKIIYFCCSFLLIALYGIIIGIGRIDSTSSALNLIQIRNIGFFQHVFETGAILFLLHLGLALLLRFRHEKVRLKIK